MNKLSGLIATIFKRDYVHDGTRRAALAVVEEATRENQEALDRFNRDIAKRPDKMREVIRELLEVNDRATGRGTKK